MKRIISIVLTVIMIISTGSVTFAEQTAKSNVKVLKKYEEITDINVLLDRAKHDISDLIDKDKITEIKLKATLKNKKTKEEKDMTTYETTQLVAVTEESGAIKNYYATNILAESSVNYTREDSDWGDSYSVKASSTIYWSEYQLSGSGAPVKEFYKVSGNWSISDTSVSVSRRSVDSHNGGIDGADGSIVDEIDYDYPSSNSFSYSLSFTPLTTNYGVFGADTHALLTRGTSSEWYIDLNNSLTF